MAEFDTAGVPMPAPALPPLPTFYIPADPSDPAAIPIETVPGAHIASLLAMDVTLPETSHVKPVKLGRKAPRADRKCLAIAPYIDRLRAQPLPASCDHLTKALPSIKQTVGNTSAGDCVIASTMHGEGIASGNDTGTPVLSSENEALSEYGRICGPGDNGCNIQDVLNEWQNNGITIGGTRRKIDGWVEINPANPDEVKTAILVFGSCRFGFNVPSDFMNTPDGGVWDVSNGRIVGGHDVRGCDFGTVATGFTADGVRIATWGGTRIMTWRLLATTSLVDEAYTELMPDWSGSDGLAPNGIKVADLKADLAAWKQGQIPPWSPDPTPPSPPPSPGPTPPPIPVPTAFPNYIGQFKNVWGSLYPVILSPVPTVFHAPAFGPVVSWFTIVMDGITLFQAVMSRDVSRIIPALMKLAADFGLSFAPQPFGRPEVVWSALIAAVQKLVADLLTAWTSGLPLSVLIDDFKAVFSALTT